VSDKFGFEVVPILFCREIARSVKPCPAIDFRELFARVAAI
jgi:hypothetical protein